MNNNWQQTAPILPGGSVFNITANNSGRASFSTGAGWERVLETEQSILHLGRLEQGRGFLALTANQVIYSPDGLSWSAVDEGVAGQMLLDLHLSPVASAGQLASVLTTGGLVWQRRF